MRKALLVTPFSKPSQCGVWNRVFNDAVSLEKNGYDVTVISSNILKGTDKLLKVDDLFNNISIKRKRVRLKIGGAMFFSYISDFRKIKPDIVHVHGYRHPASLLGVILAKLYRKKAIITTHGSIGEKDPGRSVFMKLFDLSYDLLIGWWELRLYNKIIIIANWEEKYLKRFRINSKKVILIPNPIHNSFTYKTTGSSQKEPKKSMFYMGRLDPIKRLEWIKDAAKRLKKYSFKIIGPLSGYKTFKSSSSNLDVELKAYDREEFITEAAKHDIFIMPSIRESFGITALEAMSQGKIVISSRTTGVMEYLIDGKNGFIVESPGHLVLKIEEIYSEWNKMLEIQNNAIRTAKEYKATTINKLLLDLYNSLSGR